MPFPPCPTCGAVPEAEARFCGTCGAKLTPPAPAPAPSRPAVKPVSVSPPVAMPPPSRPAVKPVSVSPPAATPPPSRPGIKPVAAAATPAPAPPPSRPAVSPVAAPPPAGAANYATVMSAPPIAATRSLDKLIGTTLNNRYEVKRKIGEGGFGAVFEGRQLATGREVALKVLHPHNVSDATVVARFRREAEACSKLRSPHIVTLYDFDETPDGTLYLAMELVRGRSLQQLQRSDGPMPVARVLRVLDQVAGALAEAHEKGIVHRDMKPENVMVETRDDEDSVKVLDFGIAKIVSGDGAKNTPALTAIGQTVGTLEFMSPEQLRGKSLDGRSDIYALGMMTYEMLTGELPFQGAKNPTEIIQFHLNKPAPPPSELRPELKIPGEMDAVVLKMVAKSRDDRHADANALRQHIQDTITAIDTSAHRRELVRVAAVIGGIAVLVATAVVLMSR